MRLRHLLIAVFILAITWHTAAAQLRKKNVQADPPPLERVVSGATAQSHTVLSDLIAVKPEMPLGPLDVLKAYEIAMSLVGETASSDFSVIT